MEGDAGAGVSTIPYVLWKPIWATIFFSLPGWHSYLKQYEFSVTILS